MKLEVEAVRTRHALRAFIHFPEHLYRNDPNWVPPIWIDERQTFTVKNPVLAHSDYILLLAQRDGKAVGRILAYVDHSFNAFYRLQIGFFGSFEAVEDDEVAAALYQRAEIWLKSSGMTVVRGPINPVPECWGFLFRGYDDPPMFMSPYNPAYYNRYAEQRGYAKVKDLLVYEGDAQQGYQIPERFVRFREKLLIRRPNISVRRFDMKNLSREAEFVGAISNEAVANNWGYVPLDSGEIKSMFRKLKPIVDPDAIWMVEDRGIPVGYALGFPDINGSLRKIRGRLLPFGFVTLLRGLRSIRDYRLFGLAVLPAYHNWGLDVLLYMSLFEALAPRGVHLEANYILEDNPHIRNALEKLDLRQTKVYRVYEKRLD